ncbi:MAG: hypothetical protein GY865_17030 [candidate division Zixibacteria bacterium]|nr:hypothetical protein [candidate division Zixibacteria bacterium]
MSIFNNQIRYNMIFVLIVILFCSTQSIANESNSNKLSINSRLHDNSSLILSYPITLAKTDEISQDNFGLNKPLAEDYLKSISNHGKKTRIQQGISEIINGVIYLGFGISYNAKTDDKYSPITAAFVSVGVLFTINGIHRLTNYGPEENEYSRINSISDFEICQEEATESINHFAAMGRKKRTSGATIDFLFTVFYILGQPIEDADGNEEKLINIGLGAIHFLSGIIRLGTQSHAEKTLEQYKRDMESDNSLKVQIRSNYSNELQLVLFKQF